MSKLRYIAIIALFFSGLVALSRYADLVIDWLFFWLIQSKPSTSIGVLASLLGSVLGFCYIAATQNMRKRGHIRRYRGAELSLVEMGRMDQDEILEYHRSYNWYAYAGLGFQSVFVIVPLFFGDQIQKMSPADQTAVFIGLAALGISTILLGIIDFFHTNTLTPLVTNRKRFELIDTILKIGGLSIFLQTTAVGVFLSLINSWLSVATSVIALWLMVFITERRGVPVDALAAERGLGEHELSRVLES